MVGREKERHLFTEALAKVKGRQGACWLVEGPGGIGKSRLIRWVADLAEQQGFEVRWANCFKEATTPFLPWVQLFRKGVPAPRPPPTGAAQGSTGGLPPLLLFEEERVEGLRELVAHLPPDRPALLVSRDRPALVRERTPGLASSTRTLWLSRIEGDDHIPPGQLDTLGERIEKHLHTAPGSVAAVEGIEYLVSQSNFPSVLSLLQFLRDVAQESASHLLISVRPGAFEKRELALLESLGEVSRASPSGSGATNPAALSQREDEPPALVMLRYLDTLEAATTLRPQVIVLDDLQWADSQSMRSFQFLARNSRALPVLLLAALRTDRERTSEKGPEGPNEEILEEMGQEGTLQRLRLGGVPPEDARKVLTSFLGAPLDARGREEEFLSRTGGSPYLLLATTQMLVEEGKLRKDAERAVLELAQEEGFGIPRSVRRVVARRLDHLTSQERKLLEVGAILGREFDLEPVSFALGTSPTDLHAALLRLESERGFVRRVDGSPGRWAFTQPLTWETVLDEVPTESFRKTSAQLGTWCSRTRPTEPVTVARFFHDAQRPDPGLEWVRAALDGAIRAHDAQLTEKLHAWLQDLLVQADVNREARVAEGCATLQRLMVEVGAGSDAAERMARQLVALVPPGAAPAQARMLLLRVLSVRNPKEARQLVPLVEEEVRTPPAWFAPEYAVHWAVVRAALLQEAGRFDEAIEVCERALQDPRIRANIPVAAPLMYRVAWNLFRRGKSTEATQLLEQLKENVPRFRTVRDRLLVLNLQAFMSMRKGSLKEAESCWHDAAELSRSAGDVTGWGIALGNLSQLRTLRGDLDGAESVLKDALQLVNRFHLPKVGLWVRVVRAEILLQRQRIAEALTSSAEVEADSLRLGYLEQLATLGILRTEALLRSGDARGARESLEGVEASHQPVDAEEQPRLWLARALVQEALGLSSESRGCLEKVLVLSEEMDLPFWRARAFALIRRWEQAHGDGTNTAARDPETMALFDRCGVLPQASEFYSWWPGDPRAK